MEVVIEPHSVVPLRHTSHIRHYLYVLQWYWKHFSHLYYSLVSKSCTILQYNPHMASFTSVRKQIQYKILRGTWCNPFKATIYSSQYYLKIQFLPQRKYSEPPLWRPISNCSLEKWSLFILRITWNTYILYGESA
jgi:hypothetical protein